MRVTSYPIAMAGSVLVHFLCAAPHVASFASTSGRVHPPSHAAHRLSFHTRSKVLNMATNTHDGEDSSQGKTTTTTIPMTMENPSSIMDEIMKGNATAASTAVDMLMQVRGTAQMEQYLNEMLPPEKADLPLWTRLPLTKFSRRARQLRLRKLLLLSTPSTEKEDNNNSNSNNNNDNDAESKAKKSNFTEEDNEESKNRRYRRSLFILLRNMSNNPDYNGISQMLSMAKNDARIQTLSGEELQKRTPSDLETPNYQVLSTRKNGLEIRRYDQFSVCSVTMNDLQSNTNNNKSNNNSDRESAAKLSNPQLSGATSFGALAGYLFGKNQQSKAMKMTTPVFTQGEGDSKTMSFVLPSDYWSEGGVDKAPAPMSDSAVKVSAVDGGDRAVLAFGGFGRKGEVEVQKEKLRKLVAKDEEWKEMEGGVDDDVVMLAQYNDPFTPPWKRRNEVSIAVVPRNCK